LGNLISDAAGFTSGVVKNSRVTVNLPTFTKPLELCLRTFQGLSI
jgi:hypothetical protein